MNNSKRFKPIVDMAHDSERQAARALGTALQRLDESEQQLSQLHRYRDEYIQRLQQVGTQGMSGQQLNEYRNFMAKIDTAITSQTATVAQMLQILDEKKNFWFSKRGRSKALDSVLDSYLKQEQTKLDKRDQREQDDRAGRNSGDDS